MILELVEPFKRDEAALNEIAVRNRVGILVPLTSFSSVKRTFGPTSINLRKNAIVMIDFALHAQRKQGLAPAEL